jgi:ATP-binding cassette subfamily F protein 3
MLLSQANFLIMDEPTNHLDIVSKEALEQALQEYDGTLLLIAHDRYFLSKLVSRVVELKDRKLKIYEGNYNDYMEKRIEEETSRNNLEDGTESRAKSSVSGRKTKAEKRSEAEARDAFNRIKRPVEQKIKKLEEQIEKLENRKKDLEIRMSDPEMYSQTELIRQLPRDYAEVKDQLKSLYAEWEIAHEALEVMKRENAPIAD